MKGKSKLYKVFIYVALFTLAISIIVPIAWVFLASIKENSEFYGDPWALPNGFYVQNFLDAFQKALEHEIYMSESINELSDLSMKNKDHATYNLLQWYVTEQVEEEVALNTIIDKMKLIGDNGYGLYVIDQELATRVFVDPTAVA